MIYYDVRIIGTNEKFIITADEVVEVMEKKAQGFEFIRIRDNFFNPKYISSITPNYNFGSSGPGVEPENPIRIPNQDLIKKLEGKILKRLK